MEYTCPYCNHPTTVTGPNRDTGFEAIDITHDRLGLKNRIGLRYEAIACPNTVCRKLSLNVELKKMTQKRGSYSWEESDSVIESFRLRPESKAKPQPDYIPEAIIKDYSEACRIVNLSPKSSATLSRRCLQGIIRDFWGINKSRLKDAVDALEDVVDADTWEAIDAVRSVGNIGAHMEKDVNIIIDIEPEEAELLIGLIEDLIEDWYVTRHNREERKNKLKVLAVTKSSEKHDKKAAALTVRQISQTKESIETPDSDEQAIRT